MKFLIGAILILVLLLSSNAYSQDKKNEIGLNYSVNYFFDPSQRNLLSGKSSYQGYYPIPLSLGVQYNRLLNESKAMFFSVKAFEQVYENDSRGEVYDRFFYLFSGGLQLRWIDKKRSSIWLLSAVHYRNGSQTQFLSDDFAVSPSINGIGLSAGLKPYYRLSKSFSASLKAEYIFFVYRKPLDYWQSASGVIQPSRHMFVLEPSIGYKF